MVIVAVVPLIAALAVKVDRVLHHPARALQHLPHRLRAYQPQQMAHAEFKTITLSVATILQDLVVLRMGTAETRPLTVEPAARVAPVSPHLHPLCRLPPVLALQHLLHRPLHPALRSQPMEHAVPKTMVPYAAITPQALAAL